jgi:hypothetical protein
VKKAGREEQRENRKQRHWSTRIQEILRNWKLLYGGGGATPPDISATRHSPARLPLYLQPRRYNNIIAIIVVIVVVVVVVVVVVAAAAAAAAALIAIVIKFIYLFYLAN